MKFTVSSSLLQKELSKLSGIISNNPVMPILEDINFLLAKNVLKASASNVDTSMIIDIEVNGEEDGELAIPAKILLDTLKALPDQPIVLDANVETRMVEISSAYGTYKLSGDDSSEFPKIVKPETSNKITLLSHQLSNAVTNTLFATGNDEMRPALTGVLFKTDFNRITFVATDAHKLVKYTISNDHDELSINEVVPKKALQLLKSFLPENVEVIVSFTENSVCFEYENTLLLGKLIDAKFPDYNAVIPVDNPNILTIDRNSLFQSLRRISIYANKSTNQVNLKLSDGQIVVTARDLDYSNEANETLVCNYIGEPHLLGFNGKFLIEMLNVIDSEEVRLEISTPNRPSILVPSEQADDEDLMMLVMPVMPR